MARNSSRGRRLGAIAATAVAAALALAGCGGGGGSSSGGSQSGPDAAADDKVMNIYTGTQTPIVANFNPFSPTRLHAAAGVMYEPLFYYNKVADVAPLPLLAESKEWNEDGTELTIKLKQGVKWSDGEDFTAEDVAYSFMYPLAKPDYLTDATVVDDQTVVLSFDDPAFTSEFTLLGSTYMIPEHIWVDIEDPDTFTNTEPVVTGPYTVDTTSESAFTAKANPHFREEGKPAVKRLRFLGLGGGQSVEDLIATGALDWTSLFTPDPESLTADGRMAYIENHVNPTAIFTCANADLGCTGPQTEAAVRLAINAALDRGALNTKAFGGTAGVASPTFALPGRDDRFISKSVTAESPQTANVDEAKKILEDAGWTLGSDGIYEKDGQKLSMRIISVDGWVDYNTAARLISEQLGNAGMNVEANTVALSELLDARLIGNFDLMLNGIVGSSVPDPWVVYNNYFTTWATAPVGDQVPTGLNNSSRYSNAVVDDAVKSASMTNDTDELAQYYAVIQEQIEQDMPYIPLIISATQAFFNVEDYTGWPTEEDMYAFPPPWENVAAGVILTRVEPK